MRVYAENAIRELPEFERVAAQYPSIEWMEDYQTFRLESTQKEKDCVILARKRGAWLKPFHCYHQNHEYRYYSMDVAEGCPFECVYCYLQSYLNHGALVLFVNGSGLQGELDQMTGDRLWISTGLLSDSLVAEASFAMLPGLRIPDGAILELRTKSADISALDHPHIQRKDVVVSWSLNPEKIATQFEYRAAPLVKRLEAAQRAMELGYRVGFHLDPVFHFDGWQSEYSRLLRELQRFDFDRTAFLSLGIFRYMPDLGAVIRKRFPFHPILTGEFFPAEDGKYHYLRGIRKEMYEAFLEWLQPWRDANIPVFWSMEPGIILNTKTRSHEDLKAAR